MSLVNDESSCSDTEEQKRSVRALFDHDPNWKGEVYSRCSDVYARGVQRRVHYVMQMLNDLISIRKGVALDVGCGPGVYLRELAHRGFRCIGVDLSEEMVRICQQRLCNESIQDVRIMIGDIEDIPLEASTIDLLLCIGVIQYVDSLTRALGEIDRVTKTDGVVVMCFENLMSLSNIDWVVRQRLNSLWGASTIPDGGLSMISQWFLNRPEAPHRYRLYNPRKFEKLMMNAGFQKLDAMTYGFEFRFIRKLGLVPEPVLNTIEAFLERFFRKHRVPYFYRSGEFYIGVFKKQLRLTGMSTVIHEHKKIFSDARPAA